MFAGAFRLLGWLPDGLLARRLGELRCGAARPPDPRLRETSTKAICRFDSALRSTVASSLRQIAARFLLNHGQLIDEHFGQLEIHFAFAGLRIRNLPEKKRGVLRVHHDKLDEALRKLAALGVGLDFSHIYFSFRGCSWLLAVGPWPERKVDRENILPRLA